MKIRNLLKTLAVVFLCAAMVLPFAACGEGDSPTRAAGAEIWGTYNTAKVARDPASNGIHEKLPAEMQVSLARGETESAQIIVTANRDISDIRLETAELVNENGTPFKTENMTVYFQRYMEVTVKTRNDVNNVNYPVGWYPDALIPQDRYIWNGENFVAAGHNQAITVDFAAGSAQREGETAQEAGTYTGNFTLNLEGERVTVPVSVTVWDFDNVEVHGSNLWDIVEGFHTQGELNSTGDDYALYYETMLKYKLNAYHLPNDETNADTMLAGIRKYWNDPAFNGYFFPDFQGNSARISDYIYTIGMACVEDGINYLEVASFYHQSVDEPQGSQDKIDRIDGVVDGTYAGLEDGLERLEAEAKFTSSALADELRVTIPNIPQVVTTYYDAIDSIQGRVSFCPTIDEFDSLRDRRLYGRNREETNQQTWTYTCLSPYYPYPSYHIDDYLIGGRTLKWMQKDYNIEGYLNWAINFDIAQYAGGTYTVINPYETPLRLNLNGIHFANGDGYLFYPAKKYETAEPLPSIRLLAARDGQEDYDMLCLLEEQYAALESTYGLAAGYADPSLLLSEVYASLYSGTVYNTSNADFDAAKNAVGKLTEGAFGDNKTMIVVRPVSDDYARIEVYTAAESVSVGGTALTSSVAGSGRCFSSLVRLSDDVKDISVQVGSGDAAETYTVRLGKKHYAFDLNALETSDIALSEGSTAVKTDGGFSFRVVSWGDTMIDQLINVPSVSILMDLDYPSLDSIRVTVRNNRNADLEFQFKLYNGSVEYLLDEVVLFAGETYTFEVGGIAESGWANLAMAEGVRLTFANSEGGVLLPNREFEILGISYTNN